MTRARKLFLAFALVLITLGVFQEVRFNDFVGFDDDVYLKLNDHVRAGLTLEGVRWAWTSMYASNWHPLTWISHMLDVEVFGMEPAGHHLTNLLLHLVNVLLVFLALGRLTGYYGRSAMVAALFALHPLHVESVAWVSERKDLLSAAFGLMAIYLYAVYAKRANPLAYLGVFLCLALGLAAKPMLVTLPFLLLLFDIWPLERWHWLRIVEKLPLIALAIFSSVITLMAQQSGHALESLDVLPVSERIANTFIAYLRYVFMTFWPVDLAVFYPHPISWPLGQVFASASVAAAVSWLALRAIKTQGWFFVGWFWFVGMLVPVIGIVQVGEQSLADRYMYLPILGLLILIVWAAAFGLGSGRLRWLLGLPWFVAALVGCGFLTFHQVRYWRDTVTLFSHALDVTEENHVAHHNLAAAYAGRGELKQAIPHFKEALRIRPGYADAHYNLGTALGRRGDLNSAIQELTLAQRIRPRHPDTLFNLASAYEQIGDSKHALLYFEQLVAAVPGHARAWDRVGYLWSEQGDRVQAIDSYQRALALDESLPRARRHLAWLLSTAPEEGLRNGVLGLELARVAAQETEYQNVDDLDLLAAAFAEAGQFPDAIETAERSAILAREAGNSRLAAAIEQRLTLYRAGKAYREGG